MNLLKYIALTVTCLSFMTLATAQDTQKQKENAQQEKAMAAPEKAKPVTITKDATSALQIKPAPQQTSAVPSQPAAPKQPAYMEKAADMPQTTIKFAEPSHDFGKIKQGDIAKHTFRFTNTGTEPLVLTRVKPSCGCTAPKWTREEVAPGEEGMIDIAFNSGGKRGMQSKSVVVTGNFEERTIVLRFKGEVVIEVEEAPSN